MPECNKNTDSWYIFALLKPSQYICASFYRFYSFDSPLVMIYQSYEVNLIGKKYLTEISYFTQSARKRKWKWRMQNLYYGPKIDYIMYLLTENNLHIFNGVETRFVTILRFFKWDMKKQENWHISHQHSLNLFLSESNQVLQLLHSSNNSMYAKKVGCDL